MKSLIKDLLTLQGLQFKTLKGNPSRSEQIKSLRTKIPESLLSTFDRFVARNKRAVSVLRRGVCGECHIQVAVGILGDLAFGHGLHQCGNCGRFLFLPEDEPVFPASGGRNKPPRAKKVMVEEEAAVAN